MSEAERLLSLQEALTQLGDTSRKDREGSILWTIHCLGPFWHNLVRCLETTLKKPDRVSGFCQLRTHTLSADVLWSHECSTSLCSPHAEICSRGCARLWGLPSLYPELSTVVRILSLFFWNSNAVKWSWTLLGTGGMASRLSLSLPRHSKTSQDQGNWWDCY